MKNDTIHFITLVIVTFNVGEHLQNELLPVVIKIVAAIGIYTHQVLFLFFLLFQLVRWKNVACHLTLHPEVFCTADSLKLQLYLWLHWHWRLFLKSPMNVSSQWMSPPNECMNNYWCFDLLCGVSTMQGQSELCIQHACGIKCIAF